MSEIEAWLLEQNIGCLDLDNLRQLAYELRSHVIMKANEIALLRQDLATTKSESKWMQSGNGEIVGEIRTQAQYQCPCWVLAEQDYPSPTSTVLVFDSFHKRLNTEMAKTLTDEPFVISQLPSRWTRTLYVFEETITQTNRHSGPRVRVTTEKESPEGLLHHSTIHLEKLPMEERIQVFFGQIKWIFILRQPDSRKSTWSSSSSHP
jgi:hypothetical protein